MMKQLKHILLVALALAFLTMSCVDPLEPMPRGFDGRLPDKALVFSPSILGSTVVTKAINTGDDDLGELAIETLDVYVYKITSGAGDNAVTEFFKRYHFITVIPEGQTEESLATNSVFVKTAADLTSGTDIILETDWRQAGYDQSGTQPYRIYSIANSRMSGADRWANLSEADLKARTITSAETHSGSYDIVRPKDGVGPGGDYYNIHIKDKNFLMDGMIDDWKITVNESQQYFTLNEDNSFPLTRAAAKFIVNLSFDPNFLQELKEEGTIITTQAPRFKFANFMPVTYEVTPASTPDGSWRDTYIWNSRYNYDFPDHVPEGELNDRPLVQEGEINVDNPSYYGNAEYSLTTYSYSFSWENAMEGSVSAPAVVVIVNYKTGEKPAESFYYRIPLVDLTKISSIDRNYLYVVDATISSKGAIIEDIVPMNVDLRYKVIPWPAGIRPEDVTDVQGANLLYFTADTTYTLRGENVQSTKLEFFTPKSVKGTSGHYEYEPKISNIRVYFVPAAGDTTNMMTVANPSNPYSWEGSNNNYSGSRTVITVTPNKDGGGTVDVSSNVLASRAVKHIEFDASVTFTVPDPTEDDPNHTIQQKVTHHYFIKHFPLDNIQSVLGAWSSRWNGVPAEHGSKWKRLKFKRTVTTGENLEISQEEWAIGIGNANEDRMRANSREKAIAGYYATDYVTGNEGSYTTTIISNDVPRTDNPTITWSGTSRVTFAGGGRNYPVNMPLNGVTYDYVSSYDYDYDWFFVEYNRRAEITYKKYEHYYHDTETTEVQYTYDPSVWGGNYDTSEWVDCSEAEYNESFAINPDYGQAIPVATEPGIANNWVNWAEHTGSTYTDYNGNYTAKYWGGYYPQGDAHGYGRNHVFSMTGNNSGTLTNYSNNWNFDPDEDLLSNNHMYVIQISKAENGVVLGRPRQDANNHYRSNDNVVSPAFMIASQLGAVGTFSSANDAADHCHTYLEVTRDGRRFTGWRLPTAAEIAYIVGYQGNTNITSSGVFEPVITGTTYYTLDGQTTNTGIPNQGNNRVRCVRDLSPAEVEELNSTGIITDATY
jgi:hypothetical protein